MTFKLLDIIHAFAKLLKVCLKFAFFINIDTVNLKKKF